jgi:ribosomal protein L29
MKTQDLRKQSIESIPTLLDAKRKELHEFRAGLSHGKVRNVKSARSLRRDIAQLLTRLHEGAKAR